MLLASKYAESFLGKSSLKTVFRFNSFRCTIISTVVLMSLSDNYRKSATRSNNPRTTELDYLLIFLTNQIEKASVFNCWTFSPVEKSKQWKNKRHENERNNSVWLRSRFRSDIVFIYLHKGRPPLDPTQDRNAARFIFYSSLIEFELNLAKVSPPWPFPFSPSLRSVCSPFDRYPFSPFPVSLSSS